MPKTIEPFQISTSDEALADLKRRLQHTRWPERETVDDWTQGMPLGYTQEICEYWANEYDWRATEARLNALPHFRTEIDGLGIHFLHVRSKDPSALPLIMTHGWPGSFIEFLKVIGPLTDPAAHGLGDDGPAFHIVCPSLPGYGYSEKPSKTGWNADRIADAWSTLMQRLGYQRYFAQGGDWGAIVTTSIGARDKEHCLGIHLNMPVVMPDPDTMNDLTADEQDALDGYQYYQQWDSSYATLQSTRPQTVAYGLADSPAAQLAWIVEKFHSWTDCDGHPENALSRDELLDNVMLYWLTETAASSARLYWESFAKINSDPVQVPVGCSIFPKEIFRSSRRWAEKQFPQLAYWNRLDKGGHFAAFEQPDMFVQELRACFAAMTANQ
ncbi:MAG: epoxide hydrolase [Gammaproteobacteria bacterium]|nr:epoxide hydrolase [Gammaproteobacteria bacterium]NND39771.1 epoxide hydrolase [Pseudomonadales bacterium]RZV55568.1 MAG: epoxide hydrolase [Pseudomonadales bacterium]